MKATNSRLAAIAAAAMFVMRCSGSGPTAPEPPASEGELFIVDNGCACAPKPWTPIPIFVDRRQAGLLPILGKLSIPLPPGSHTWSDTPNDPSPTPVVIQLGGVVTVNLETNYGCVDGCVPNPGEVKRGMGPSGGDAFDFSRGGPRSINASSDRPRPAWER